ncbi:MAG: Ig-like domain-containing protein, partial [Chloroflexota bacterium]|nr:Ig-like domain-containing protein [Chloroflexota bacterium]
MANNGGPTQTIALTTDSPALNAIPKGQSGCATTTDRVTTDQRGVKRPQGEGCDIGAFETDDRAPAVSTVVPAENATGMSPGVNLTATFTEKMDRATLNKTTFKLFKVNRDGSSTQITGVSVSTTTNGLKAALNPESTLAQN